MQKSNSALHRFISDSVTVWKKKFNNLCPMFFLPQKNVCWGGKREELDPVRSKEIFFGRLNYQLCLSVHRNHTVVSLQPAMQSCTQRVLW